MSFKDRSWEDRYAKMGDEAEGVFEDVYPHGYVRFGLNRPPLNMSSLGVKIRYTPDYLTSASLVEVQGHGADGRVKLKHEKLAALREWATDHPGGVRMFLWDSTNKRHALVELPELERLFVRHGEERTFPEGKGYWSVDADHVEGWVEYA